jgi:hypothetical protein
MPETPDSPPTTVSDGLWITHLIGSPEIGSFWNLLLSPAHAHVGRPPSQGRGNCFDCQGRHNRAPPADVSELSFPGDLTDNFADLRPHPHQLGRPNQSASCEQRRLTPGSTPVVSKRATRHPRVAVALPLILFVSFRSNRKLLRIPGISTVASRQPASTWPRGRSQTARGRDEILKKI